jgi:hypothetical protein
VSVRGLATVVREGKRPERGCGGALRFLILTAVRKGAVIEATWEEFDLDLGC